MSEILAELEPKAAPRTSSNASTVSSAVRSSSIFSIACMTVGKTCPYCALALAVTEDYIFAREFFLLDDRDNLPKAPACART